MTPLPSDPSENADFSVSGLALARQLFTEFDYREGMRAANLVPLSSADAAEATELMLGYHLWSGQFLKAKDLLENRINLGVPETVGLIYRRWQIVNFCIFSANPERLNIKRLLEEHEAPHWAKWSNMLFRLFCNRGAAITPIVEMAQNENYQARMLVDPIFYAGFESLVIQIEVCVFWFSPLRKAVEALSSVEFPQTFRFGLSSYHDLSPRFRGLFALDLLNDEIFLDKGAAAQNPKLHAEFLQWFSECSARMRILLERFNQRVTEVLKNTLYELSCACVESGSPENARVHLLHLASLDFEKFKHIAHDLRLANVKELLDQIIEVENLQPGAADCLRHLDALKHEPKRLAENIDTMPVELQKHPLVRRILSLSAYYNSDFPSALKHIEGLESGFGSELALLRGIARNAIEGVDGLWEELECAPPTAVVHPWSENNGYFRDFSGDKPAIFELIGRLAETDVENLQPKKGQYAVYLSIHSNTECHRFSKFPERKYLLHKKEDSPGGAIRCARSLVREALIALGTPLPVADAKQITAWARIIGLEVQIVPDLRPHYVFERQLEATLPEVIEELNQEETEEEDFTTTT